MKQELLDYANKLKAAGLTVFLPEDARSNYIHFGDDKNVGYCQYAAWEGFSFSTVHKPNRQTGTGFRVHGTIGEPTVQHAKDTFVLAPYWASAADKASVVKYNGVRDYVERETILEYRELT